MCLSLKCTLWQHSSNHHGIPSTSPGTEGTEQFTRTACKFTARERWLCTLHCFLKTPAERRAKASQLGLLELSSSTSAEGFARCADEVCTPCSCNPVMSPPDHRMENDIGGGLKFNRESEGVCMGQRTQETRTLLGLWPASPVHRCNWLVAAM